MDVTGLTRAGERMRVGPGMDRDEDAGGGEAEELGVLARLHATIVSSLGRPCPSVASL